METQIVDSYRAMKNSSGIPMIILSDLESAFEPESVYLTQSGLNLATKDQRIVIRNLDSDMLTCLREVKYLFISLTDIELQTFNYEKTVSL